VWWCV